MNVSEQKYFLVDYKPGQKDKEELDSVEDAVEDMVEVDKDVGDEVEEVLRVDGDAHYPRGRAMVLDSTREALCWRVVVVDDSCVTQPPRLAAYDVEVSFEDGYMILIVHASIVDH